MSNQEVQEQEQEQEQEQVNETFVPKVLTIYTHYNESDDLTKLFNDLNEFRKNYGLKYSHQGHEGMIFFNISSEHLDAFSKLRLFKISKFQSKTEYKCDQATCDKLKGQKDSFLKMIWNEKSGVLTFLSRTPANVHKNLVKRIFKDSGVVFKRDSYTQTRKFLTQRDNNYNNYNNQNDQNDQNDQNNQIGDNNDCAQENAKGSKTYKTPETPEGFQRVEKKTRKPNTMTSSKVFKDTQISRTPKEPKVRGAKTFRQPESNA